MGLELQFASCSLANLGGVGITDNFSQVAENLATATISAKKEALLGSPTPGFVSYAPRPGATRHAGCAGARPFWAVRNSRELRELGSLRLITNARTDDSTHDSSDDMTIIIQQ